MRFDDSPPPDISDRSGMTTRSQSSNPLSEEQQRRQERRIQLGREREASLPYNQFENQTSDEEKRIYETGRDGTRYLRVGDNPSEIAYGNVKKRWVEQGIWNNKWNQFASGFGSRILTSSPFFPQESHPKQRCIKSDEEKRRIAERRVVREREREAPRPYHQFVYQKSKERERIQEDSVNEEGVDSTDINARAYENIKNTWTKRGIWNRRWAILTGLL